ncbi:c-type cytochrome [Proteobacteria bacterium 005FR1]|nr:c-type cytochrome [Proteobacteria bacterium 005FR1]
MKVSPKTGLVRPAKRTLAVIAALGFAALLFGYGLLYSGWYNVSALEQHLRPVYKVLQYAMTRAVAVRSDRVEVPDLESVDALAGLALYERHCRECHGAPGVGPDSFALGMMPAPTALASFAFERSPAEIFWLTENGIKMSGMPAWRYRMDDREIWQVVAFIKQVPHLTTPEYLALRERAAERFGSLEAAGAFEPDPDRNLVEYGRVALQQYNCGSCHEIPGVIAADSQVGPPLGGVTGRSFIAGVLANTDENLIRWIRFPREVDPKTTMPNLNVSQLHAQWMVYYLRSLEEE